MAMFGNLFKTRGAGVKYSKKGQYTKRKYIREKRFTKDAKAKRKAAADAKRAERMERMNAQMNAKLLAGPTRRGRPRGSKNRAKLAVQNEMAVAGPFS